VLAFYKLQIKESARARLQERGFPANYLKTDRSGNAQVVFPAAIAYRDGETRNGKANLRSFYFAGDASDYSLVSRINEMVPATGGISYFLGHNAGPFPTQFYWNYYQPLMQNVLSDNPNLRHGRSAS